MDDLEGHWQPVRSAILAIAGLLVFFRLLHRLHLQSLHISNACMC